MPDEFERHRRRCFSVAYRMLGSAAEAEDMVQEAWLRWQSAQGVEQPEAWLVATTTRLSIDHLKSARVRREQYVGPWLPEPVATTDESEADAESISMAFLLLLERLTPTERAVYLLRKVFDVDYAEISRTLGKSEPAVRQIFHRAGENLQGSQPRYAPTKEQHLRLLTGFMMAVQSGEVAAIEGLLADEARAWGDGGGRVRAALHCVTGRARVAKLFLGLVRMGHADDLRPEIREINGWPAMIFWRDQQLAMTLTIETDGEKIFAVHTVLNPDKLHGIHASTQAN
jgi:RNA polymerase sigma-70 factor (ECF subfamily)